MIQASRKTGRLLRRATAGIGPSVAFAVLVESLLAVTACERRPVGRSAADRGPVVATVNGTPLYKRDFDSYLPVDYQRVLTRDERKAYFDRWVTTQLLYDAATERGLGATPAIEARMEQLKKDLVADQLVQEVIRERAVVTDAEVRAYYEAHLDEYTKEYRVSHIVVGSEEDALEVKQLLQKRTFSWVARRHSLDKHTGIGGDLGFLSRGGMIPEFEEVVFAMAVGEVSDIIESDFGYHIIKLTGVREARNKLAYEDVAEEISHTLLLAKRGAVYEDLVESLRRNAHIAILDSEMRLAAEANTLSLPAAKDSAGGTVE